MAIVAAAFLAMMIAGCSSDDNGAAMVEMPPPVETPDPDPPEVMPEEPMGPETGGTLEGQEGRAAAARIAYSASADGIMPGASIMSLTQARLGAAPMLTISVAGGSGLGTADDSAAMAAPMIDGFTGVSLMKDGPGAVTQMALVYSDAERSVRAWGDVYRYNTDAMGADLGTGLQSEGARTHLRVGDTVEDEPLSMVDSKISLDHGLSTTSGVMSRMILANGTVTGSYDGVAGQYVFAAATTLMWDGTTLTVTAGTGDVLFKADDPDVVIPDRDYLAFGVWASVPDSPTTANPGMVRAFATGNAGPLTIANVNGLSGAASYSGGAVGHYASRAKGDHMVMEGRFTATAALTANFDAADAVYTDDVDNAMDGFQMTATPTGAVLSGKITDFMSEDDMAMPGWLVNLDGGMMMPDLAAAAAAANQDNDAPGVTARTMAAYGEMVTGTTSGTTGSQAFTGVWDARFFGNNTTDHPTGVAGRFQASRGTAEPSSSPEGKILLSGQDADQGFAGVVGAFGAR